MVRCAAATLASVVAVGLGSALPARAVQPASGWTIALTPTLSWSRIDGVAAIAPGDAWAVGAYFTSLSESGPLTLHWDGSSWQIVGSPSSDGSLAAVSAHAANDVWAVGTAAASARTLIERWNGASWTIVSSPSPGASDNVLTGVAALSGSDAWAVGYTQDASYAYHGLVEHWNGTSWQVASSPSDAYILTSVTAVSARDVWAVGYQNDGAPLIEHWDGVRWSIVPGPPSVYGVLQGVAANSTGDVWAVGYSRNSRNEAVTFVLHWNGSQWNVVPSPNPLHTYCCVALTSVAALSGADVWAAGYYQDTAAGARQTLLEHWNGRRWSVVTSPNRAGLNNELRSVAGTAGANVWATGLSVDAQGAAQALVLGTPSG